MVKRMKNKQNETFSLPARSTRYSFPLSFFSVSMFSCLMLIRKMLWLRELCSFISDRKRETDFNKFFWTILRHLRLIWPIEENEKPNQTTRENHTKHHITLQTIQPTAINSESLLYVSVPLWSHL